MEERTIEWMLEQTDEKLVEILHGAGRIPWDQMDYWSKLMPRLRAARPEVDASQEAKDAERYRKIKDRWSPFMVMYYGSLILGGNPDRRQVLTGELDELVDGWLEDGGGNQEWRLMLSSSAYGDKLIATSPLEPQSLRKEET